jgi:hypothetical protein
MGGLGPNLPPLSGVVGILAAMITPAVLILASGSILASTSSRLIRVVDRVRELAREAQTLSAIPNDDMTVRRRELNVLLLRSAARRARLLQRAMTHIYLSIGAFVMTSILIGVVSIAQSAFGWLALILGFGGSALLLSSCLILITESQLALSATRAETDFVMEIWET